MRRNGTENIGVDQQPVQHFTACLRQPHKLHCHPSPAQPSLAQPFLSGRSLVC